MNPRPAAPPNMPTPGQDRIGRLVLEGLPNKIIARRLHIRERTVQGQLWELYRRLNIHNRIELVLWYHKQEHQSKYFDWNPTA